MTAAARDTNLHTSMPPLPSVTPIADGDHSAKRAEIEAVVSHFSVVLGGPIYDFLVRHGIVRMALPNVMRRVGTFIAITWLPLFFLSLSGGVAFGDKVKIPLLYDYSTTGRLLLALPLLLIAEVVIDPAIRGAVEEFIQSGLVQEGEFSEFETVLQKIQALRDSAFPDLVMLVLAFFPVFLFRHEWSFSGVSSWHTNSQRLTTAGWWYATISTPLFRFLIYRWLFRYFVWALLLWKLSKINLHLMPTHPDRVAGLGFLALSQSKLGILFCAFACAFAGNVANTMVHEGAPLASFKFLIGGFVAICLILGLLPTTLFAPRLMQVRRAGLRAYGRLGNQYTEAFDRKWVHSAEPPSEPLLGSGDIQSLADLGNSYAVVEEMRIAPVTKRLVVQLAVQSAVPLIPVIILGTPTSELIKVILKMVV